MRVHASNGAGITDVVSRRLSILFSSVNEGWDGHDSNETVCILFWTLSDEQQQTWLIMLSARYLLQPREPRTPMATCTAAERESLRSLPSGEVARSQRVCRGFQTPTPPCFTGQGDGCNREWMQQGMDATGNGCNREWTQQGMDATGNGRNREWMQQGKD